MSEPSALSPAGLASEYAAVDRRIPLGEVVGRPRLGLLVGIEAPVALRALLRAMADRVRLVDGVSPAEPGPAPGAYVWYADPTEPPPGTVATAVAAWVSDAAAAEVGVPAGARLLLTDDAAVATDLRARGRRALVVPGSTVVRAARPVLPAVRRRLRALRDLPDLAVAWGEGTRWSWHEVAADGSVRGKQVERALTDTVVGLASAVIAIGAAPALRALAWGAPTVTDEVTAVAIGAVAGTDVEVAGSAPERFTKAIGLARAPSRAAALAWAGHQLVEQHFDLAWTAQATLAALGLPTHRAGGPAGAWRDRLTELGTPRESHVYWRIAALVDPLPTRSSSAAERDADE